MQQKLVPEIRKICPKVNKVIYVSDGAKQHFKNRYQMCNLMYHRTDFNIDAEWYFFGTAHGKGACDGVGAIVKREATRASLQASPNEAILDSKALFSWAKKRSFGMIFFFYSKEDHEHTRQFLAKRFCNAPPVTRIQIGHAFIPQSNDTLQVMRYSGAPKPKATVAYEIGEISQSPKAERRLRSRKCKSSRN
ncbi:hypothetical protein X777_10882 [Ooceraea biroi]|uniref:Uncharacterized protein n=1 Tax=Ooceraea biroi TaxID=2015173 RepID=A0A026W771_OOCBI|nr:hypothetical protein X777_10882 [Ooceraea biroi]